MREQKASMTMMTYLPQIAALKVKIDNRRPLNKDEFMELQSELQHLEARVQGHRSAPEVLRAQALDQRLQLALVSNRTSHMT